MPIRPGPTPRRARTIVSSGRARWGGSSSDRRGLGADAASVPVLSGTSEMRISDFDYALPAQLTAQAPIEPRDAARLLVVPSSGPLGHRMIAELPDLLAEGDLLVLNDTRVIPARLLGKKESGGKAELLLCEPLAGGLGSRWRAMGQASKRLRAGARILFDGLTATIEASEGEGFYTVLLDREGPELEVALARAGRLPLPPYIRRPPDAHDLERYQTVLARAPGSAAAPTAGLHFTAALLERLAAAGRAARRPPDARRAVRRAGGGGRSGRTRALPGRARDRRRDHVGADAGVRL